MSSRLTNPTHSDGGHRKLASLVRASFAFHKNDLKVNEYEGQISSQLPDLNEPQIATSNTGNLSSNNINIQSAAGNNHRTGGPLKSSQSSLVNPIKHVSKTSQDRKPTNTEIPHKHEAHKALDVREQGFLKEMYANEAEAHEKYANNLCQRNGERNPILGEINRPLEFSSPINNDGVIMSTPLTQSSNLPKKAVNYPNTVTILRNGLEKRLLSNQETDTIRRNRSKIDQELRDLEMTLNYKKQCYFSSNSVKYALHPAMAQTNAFTR